MKRGIWLTATIVLLALAAEGGISRLQTGSNSALAAAPAPIVEGILADSDGVPIANTAVTAYADTPVDDPSGTVPLEAIGTTQTDGSGYFALTSANPPAMRAEEATNGGYLNIKLIASDGTTLWMDGSARRFINGEWLETTAAGVDVPVAPVEGIGSMGAGTTRRLIRMHASASTKRLHLPRPFSVDPTACIIGRLAVGAAERRPATVGELHNWVDVDHSRLTYGQAADTDISYGTNPRRGRLENRRHRAFWQIVVLCGWSGLSLGSLRPQDLGRLLLPELPVLELVWRPVERRTRHQLDSRPERWGRHLAV